MTKPVGRYQIVNADVEVVIKASPSEQVHKRVFLLDTATGRTWIFKEIYGYGSGVAAGWDEVGAYVPPDGSGE